jgi:hypothetical protein
MSRPFLVKTVMEMTEDFAEGSSKECLSQHYANVSAVLSVLMQALIMSSRG